MYIESADITCDHLTYSVIQPTQYFQTCLGVSVPIITQEPEVRNDAPGGSGRSCEHHLLDEAFELELRFPS